MNQQPFKLIGQNLIHGVHLQQAEKQLEQYLS